MPRKNPSNPTPLSNPVPLPVTDVRVIISSKINDVTSIHALKEIEQTVDRLLFREQMEKYENRLANAEEIKRYYKIKKKLKLGNSPLLMKINHLLFAFGCDAEILYPSTVVGNLLKTPIDRLADGTPYIRYHFDDIRLSEHLIKKYGATVML